MRRIFRRILLICEKDLEALYGWLHYYRENANRKYRAELALKDFQEQDGKIRIITLFFYQNIETQKAEDGTVSVIFQNANDSESWYEEMLRLRQNQYSSGETVFYAVGLAHLLGEEGIIRQLQNAGYSMERVK